MSYLITLSEYKAFAGISSTSNDTQINALIAAVDDEINNYIYGDYGTIIQGNFTEVINGTGNNFLRLSVKPIISISSVIIGYNTSQAVTYSSSDFIFDANKALLYFNPQSTTSGLPGYFPQGSLNISLSFTAGYIVNSDYYVHTCVIADTGPNVTMSDTTGLVAGMPVSGSGIVSGTKILSVTNSTTIVLTANPTGDGSVSLTFTPLVAALYVPQRLKWAAFLMISRQFTQSTTNLLASSEKLDQYSINYGSGGAAGSILSMPQNSDICRILDNFKPITYTFGGY